MRKWIRALACVVLGTFIAWFAAPRVEAMIYPAIPTGRWLKVDDARFGVSPIVWVDRDVIRAFAVIGR